MSKSIKKNSYIEYENVFVQKIFSLYSVTLKK